MIEQYELRRNETQITIRDPFTLCLLTKCQTLCEQKRRKSPKTLNICSDFHPRHPLFCLCRGLFPSFSVTSQHEIANKTK